MNTPNKITLSRLLLIPIIVFFYLAEFVPYGRLVATIVFIVACLTDFLDGYLARKNNQVTTLGKFFDSIADKVLIMTGLLLICAGEINGTMPVVYPSWLGLVCVVVILAREFIVSALRQVAAAKGTVLAADMGGKIKATMQYVVVSLYMFLAFFETSIAPLLNADAMNKAIPIVRFILMLMLAGASIVTIYTGASYLIRNRHVFTENKEDDEIVKEINEEEKAKVATKKVKIVENTEERKEYLIKENQKIENMDPLLPQVLKSLIEKDDFSTATVQRLFAIGYPRAARIVDQMEEAGFVTAVNDSRKRKATISEEEFKKIFGEIDY